jgi:ATP-binding cassette subfamily C (CFTR/MRP) protein 1
MVRQTSEAEANMNCVERMDEYSRLPSEPPEEEPEDARLPAGWPLKGAVEFQEVCLRYRPELPLVLDHVSFTIQPGHKVRLGIGGQNLRKALGCAHSSGWLCRWECVGEREPERAR